MDCTGWPTRILVCRDHFRISDLRGYKGERDDWKISCKNSKVLTSLAMILTSSFLKIKNYNSLIC